MFEQNDSIGSLGGDNNIIYGAWCLIENKNFPSSWHYPNQQQPVWL